MFPHLLGEQYMIVLSRFCAIGDLEPLSKVRLETPETSRMALGPVRSLSEDSGGTSHGEKRGGGGRGGGGSRRRS